MAGGHDITAVVAVTPEAKAMAQLMQCCGLQHLPAQAGAQQHLHLWFEPGAADPLAFDLLQPQIGPAIARTPVAQGWTAAPEAQVRILSSANALELDVISPFP